MEDFAVTKIVVGIILILALIFGLCWIGGAFDIFFDKTIGVEKANVQREKFEQSASYVKGMVSDLAKYKYEFETEKDTTAKKAIIDVIISTYADFSPDKIDDASTKTFLKDIKDGKYNNLEEKK
jgi:hypothetical protein